MRGRILCKVEDVDRLRAALRTLPPPPVRDVVRLDDLVGRLWTDIEKKLAEQWTPKEIATAIHGQGGIDVTVASIQAAIMARLRSERAVPNDKKERHKESDPRGRTARPATSSAPVRTNGYDGIPTTTSEEKAAFGVAVEVLAPVPNSPDAAVRQVEVLGAPLLPLGESAAAGNGAEPPTPTAAVAAPSAGAAASAAGSPSAPPTPAEAARARLAERRAAEGDGTAGPGSMMPPPKKVVVARGFRRNYG